MLRNLSETMRDPNKATGGEVMPIEVPKNVDLADRYLFYLYRADERSDGSRWRTPERKTLLAFTKLADAKDEQVRDFAGEWGSLGVGKSYRRDDDQAGYMEEVGLWRRRSIEAKALLRIGAHLHDDRPAALGDWVDAIPSQSPLPEGLDEQRARLAERVSDWLAEGKVQPQLFWVGPAPRLRFSSPHLLGALAVRLMELVSRRETVVICMSCGRPYLPSRRPRADHRHYCPDCGAKAARRDAKREERRKTKLAQAES